MAKAGSKIKSAVSKAKSAVKNYASNVKGGAGIVAGAVKTAINKVGAKNMTGNALQATTLPGAGKVFTGNTPQQKAKSASAQQVVSQGKKVYANGTAIPAGTKQGKLVGQYITTGNSTTGTSTGFKVPMRNDAQANNAYGQPISTEGVMTNESSLTQNQVQGIQGRTSLPTTSVINAPNLGNVQRMTFPTKEDTFIPQIAPIELSTEQQLGMAQNESQNNFQQYLDRLAPPPSSEEAYQRAQRETGLLEKQQKFNELSGRLNAIVNQGEANKLSVIGQGRGIPEAILGGQQAQFARETAIQALPVQAQLSVAQGDLEMAEQNLNTLFKIYSDDATNEYNYRKGINEAIYNFTDKQTQSKIQALQKKQDREYEQQQSDIKMKQELATIVTKFGGSSALIKSIADAPNYTSALAIKGVSRYMSDPVENAIKNAQLSKLNAELSGSSGLSQDQKEKIASNPTAKQSVARIGVIGAVQDYISKLEKYKGPSGTIDFNRLSRGEKKELQTALRTTVGSAVNVAQGQGAMGEEEAKRILSDLEPTRWTRTSVFSRAAKGVIDAQKSLLNSELSFLDSTYGGILDLPVYRNYLSGTTSSSSGATQGFSQEEESILNSAYNENKQTLPASSFY